MSRDAQTRFHEEWLGLAQPYEGLVFSVPVLADAQITPEVGAELSARLKRALVFRDAGAGHIGDLSTFFADFLGYQRPGMLIARAALPPELSFYAQEGRQQIRPSFAIARGPFPSLDADDPFAGFGAPEQAPAAPAASPAAQSPFVALAWDLRDDAGEAGLGLSLDKPEEQTGSWRYPPTAKLERLLRHTGVPIGLLCNGRELRLVYAPTGESTSHLTFRLADMQEPSGRPLLAACELLLHASRTYQAADAFTVEGLLRESRRRQADVTKDLAAQVFEAVELLLEGFEHAALRDTAAGGFDWLRAALEAGDDHLYQGVLSVVLRIVFLLYAEDQGLLPVGHETYARHLSVQGLYADLVGDAGMHPESMHHRFGAYGRLLALFRAMFLGVEHGDLRLPPRRGKLFDPSTYPFLEGGLPESTAAIVSPEARAQVRPPSLDDGSVHALLHRLIVFEGQRLSYRALDVEQIGSIYESLMGYHVLRVETPAVRLGSNRVWIETGPLKTQRPAERAKWLKETCGLSAAQIGKVESALKEHTDDAALAEALNELSPGRKSDKARHRAPPGRLVLQPGEERRRSGSHYTPRSLTERIVRRTLEPLLKCLGEAPSETQILSLKLCDPAMGSGAFLVEVTRQLADQLVLVWTREGKLAALAEEHGDAHLHARRLVAQRCVYGVDKNPAAVELAKLSLWLITLSSELPFTFVDHALRHGDSLVGLDLAQITSFHWQPSKQVPLFKRVLEESLDEALEHRGELIELARTEDARSQEQKRRLLDHAEHAIEKVRLVADLCVGAFFAEAKDKAREKERARRQRLVEQWLAGDESLEAELRALAGEIRARHAPFHWWLEFPEVFYEARPDPLAGGEVNGAACMEGFVGNPPFLGGTRISVREGVEYRDWLAGTFQASSLTDLSAFFFRRCAGLLGRAGTLGFVATNSISQGDTRGVGLGWIRRQGGIIYEAVTTMPWPGDAAVVISVVHVALGIHVPELRLDGQRVPKITAFLSKAGHDETPGSIAANRDLAVIGSFVLGIGFVFDDQSVGATPLHEMSRLIAKTPRNADRVFRYLSGEDLMTDPKQDSQRFIIDFGEMSEQEAKQWPDLFTIVEHKVKTARASVKQRDRREEWWRHATRSPVLRAHLAAHGRALALSQVSTHLALTFVSGAVVLSHTCVAILLASWTAFGVLQSRIHEAWSRFLGSSMKRDLRYTPTDCFDTFPFPPPDPRAINPDVEAAGQAFYEARACFMAETAQGLTKTYNALKDPSCRDGRITALRRMHEAMDRAVLDAYGWTDLDVPPYCALTDEDRVLLCTFEDAVIEKLYLLNFERAREEKRLGFDERSRSGRKTAKRANGRVAAHDSAQGRLPDIARDDPDQG